MIIAGSMQHSCWYGSHNAGVQQTGRVSVPFARILPESHVAQLAYHFGASRLTALYRLRNLGDLTEAKLAHPGEF